MVKLKDLEVGTKVKVVKLSYEAKNEGAYRCPIGGREVGIAPGMLEFSNKIVTIDSISRSNFDKQSIIINIKEDDGEYYWTLAMFSKVIKEDEYLVLDRDVSRFVGYMEKRNLPPFLKIKKIIRNGEATICFFEDISDIWNIKTFKVVSRCVDGDTYSLVRGVRVCCLKATIKACQKQIDSI